MNKDLEDKFTYIIESGQWTKKGTKCGRNSMFFNTDTVRDFLDYTIKKYNIETILDVGCGQFKWISKTVKNIKKYTGIDIVKSVIEENIELKKEGKAKNAYFYHMDVTDSDFIFMEDFDLLIVRDVFIHLDVNDIISALCNLYRLKSKYMLISNYDEQEVNEDLDGRPWRPYNLKREPFNWPANNEVVTDSKIKRNNSHYVEIPGQNMCLWKTEDLPWLGGVK